MSTVEAQVAENFARDVAGHELTVLREDGLYRHVRFRRPDRGEYWFDLVTWPGVLVINGDMGGHGFARIRDMFEFFRSKHVNPTYWAEKVFTGREGLKTYDEDIFKRHVADVLEESEEGYPGVTEAWRAKVSGDCPEYWTRAEEDARWALGEFEYKPVGATGEPFHFTDTWEWDLRGYNYQYLWCCHAIRWGVAKYDARPSEDGTS